MGFGVLVHGFELAQRRDVVHDPECAPLGRDHEVVVADHQIRDRDDRQICLERPPTAAVVEGHVQGALHAGKEQAGPNVVFADDAHEMILR